MSKDPLESAQEGMCARGNVGQARRKETPTLLGAAGTFWHGRRGTEAREVRFVDQEPGLRLIALCKDRVGVTKRVAAYTSSRDIPGFRPGKVMLWKNPRFHYFMDGSNEARIEDQDLANITIKD
jgi:hypothetical protein